MKLWINSEYKYFHSFIFSSDLSETQRKRRSKNRLSNRKSTGYVTEAEVEAALKMGAEANSQWLRFSHEPNIRNRCLLPD